MNNQLEITASPGSSQCVYNRTIPGLIPVLTNISLNRPGHD